MPVYKDQLNRSVLIQSYAPQRIISLVPSQTELLYDLGLDVQIIGITKFCIHPQAKVKQTIKIGGTKQLNLGLIIALNPDLIIVNKEENDKTQVEELAENFPVWISDVNDLNSALQMIGSLGDIVGRKVNAVQMINQITKQFKALKPADKNPKVAYLIWRKPYMAAGTGTYIDSLLSLCGFENCIQQSRYPEVSVDDLVSYNPALVMLSSEPYPFADKHLSEIKELLPNAKVILVDGEMFSWYGSRLLYVPSYLNCLISSIGTI